MTGRYGRSQRAAGAVALALLRGLFAAAVGVALAARFVLQLAATAIEVLAARIEDRIAADDLVMDPPPPGDGPDDDIPAEQGVDVVIEGEVIAVVHHDDDPAGPTERTEQENR